MIKMKEIEYTEIEKLDEMGLLGPSFEELNMTEEDYYGPADQSPYELMVIHPNNRYNNLDDDSLFGLTPETISQIAGVDIDVFDSHQNYDSALEVANEIAKEVNHEIQRAYFNGEKSEAEDLTYNYDTDGCYHQLYQFEGQYSRVTGEIVLSEFGIYDDSYFGTN